MAQHLLLSLQRTEGTVAGLLLERVCTVSEALEIHSGGVGAIYKEDVEQQTS